MEQVHVFACQFDFNAALLWTWQLLNPLGLSISLWAVFYAGKEIFKFAYVYVSRITWMLAISLCVHEITVRHGLISLTSHYRTKWMQVTDMLLSMFKISKLPSRPPIGSINDYLLQCTRTCIDVSSPQTISENISFAQNWSPNTSWKASTRYI